MIDLRVRRDSNSSISTYLLLTSEDKGESESDITSINLNVTQEDDPSSEVELHPVTPSDTKANNPDTVVEAVNDSDETSSTSYVDDAPEDTTLKKAETTHTSEDPRQLNQGLIPSVGTPSSPWKLPRPRSTDHTPDRNSHPPTTKDSFKKPDEQLPPVPVRPDTPAKVPTPVVVYTPVKDPVTPARKTPLHKPRYTPEHPKQPIPSKLRPIPKSEA